MARSLKDLEHDIDQLAPAERARLLRSLIARLDAPSEADVEAAWLEEAERRLAEIERGDAKTVPGDRVMEEARSRLK